MTETTTTIDRTIRAVARAGTGFTTAQEPEKWFNLAKGTQLTIPPKGTAVRLTLDAKGYVLGIERIGTQGSPANASERPSEAPGAACANSTRLVLLQAAAAFLAPRSEAKSTDVVRVAEVWEAWLRGAPPPG